LIFLFENILRTGTLHYSTIHPAALENFHWNIDAKNKSITEFELIFETILIPILQTIFLKTPLIQVSEIGDIIIFQYFSMKQLIFLTI
jgi:hypothetical protein